MSIIRHDGRTAEDLREILITPGYYEHAEGSVVVEFGKTRVLCVASFSPGVPPFLKGKGQGWITAEYSMLPRSTPDRNQRERGKIGGRTQEIQRIIGRSLRTVTGLEGWGENTIMIDCDVLQADGGTRTASVTGGFVALALAFRNLRKNGKIQGDCPVFPIKDYLAAISVGIVNDNFISDLDYSEDSSAQTDMNIIMTGKGSIVEIQGTGEKKAFTEDDMTRLICLAKRGIGALIDYEKEILGELVY